MVLLRCRFNWNTPITLSIGKSKRKVTAKTKAIIINSPHNPTGRILTETDIEQLRLLVKDTGIFIISDEVMNT
jgi:aspartate/methionine/tyrosine aminotransferase